MTTILIMAGGTGGHVFPALAVADELRNRGITIEWMGTQAGIEADKVPAAGYPLTTISVQGLRGNGLLGWLMAPFRLSKAIWEARQAIQKIKPDLVLGFGGFASGPGGVAAWLAKKPLVVHEQNAIPGLTNRLLAKVADKVLTGFESAFPSKVTAEWVGNPVREDIARLEAPETRLSGRENPIRLLVLGGSLGARALNHSMPKSLALLPEHERPEVHHQCGSRNIDTCQQAYEAAVVEATILPFIEDMAEAYGWADVVVCRAGALTIAELAAVGVGSILVPFPYAVDDHQTHNAQGLEKVGAAVVVSEKTVMADNMAMVLRDVLRDRATLLRMATAAKGLYKAGSAQRIADVCCELITNEVAHA
jgi:UDP-N-acetylglucosamine--N-acetylmuramyl-(pentapeptide) pyrophosphoryl-undecaprenol N-acetylglucosamine transferase